MIRRSINKAELLKIIPLSHTTIWELEKAGDFPARFYLTGRTPVWDYDAVITWLNNRQQKPIALSQIPDVTLRKTRPVKSRGTRAGDRISTT